MIQLTKEEIDAIKEEAERLYPEPIYGTAIWAEAGWTIKRRAYIAGATSRAIEARKMLVALLIAYPYLLDRSKEISKAELMQIEEALLNHKLL